MDFKEREGGREGERQGANEEEVLFCRGDFRRCSFYGAAPQGTSNKRGKQSI